MLEDMKLYQYTEEFQNVLNFMEENDYSYEDLKDTLDAIAFSAEDKIKNTGKLIKKFQDDVTILKQHKDAITDNIKRNESKINNLKEYLLYNMTQMDIKKVQDAFITVSTRNSTSMVITNESKLPEEFIKTETVTKPLKDEFKKYYKNLSPEEQEKIKYAELVTNKSIQIK